MDKNYWLALNVPRVCENDDDLADGALSKGIYLVRNESDVLIVNNNFIKFPLFALVSVNQV